jgi:hypothetical protein
MGQQIEIQRKVATIGKTAHCLGLQYYKRIWNSGKAFETVCGFSSMQLPRVSYRTARCEDLQHATKACLIVPTAYCRHTLLEKPDSLPI